MTIKKTNRKWVVEWREKKFIKHTPYVKPKTEEERKLRLEMAYKKLNYLRNKLSRRELEQIEQEDLLLTNAGYYDIDYNCDLYWVVL